MQMHTQGSRHLSALTTIFCRVIHFSSPHKLHYFSHQCKQFINCSIKDFLRSLNSAILNKKKSFYPYASKNDQSIFHFFFCKCKSMLDTSGNVIIYFESIYQVIFYTLFHQLNNS